MLRHKAGGTGGIAGCGGSKPKPLPNYCWTLLESLAWVRLSVIIIIMIIAIIIIIISH